ATAEYEECLLKAAFVHHRPREFGILESLRYEPGRGYPLLAAHLERMSGTAAYFGFRFDAGRVRERLAREGEGLGGGAHKVRVVVDREGGVTVQSEPVSRPSAPARVALAARPVDQRDPFLYHKTTLRDGYRTRAAERPDCDDVLLVNRSGALTEATTANLVVRIDGELLTPPVEDGLLPGVLRASLLSRGVIAARRLVPEDLARAEAVYLV